MQWQRQIKVEKWKIFELTLDGPEAGNPFTDVEFSADFQAKWAGYF